LESYFVIYPENLRK